MQNRRSPMIHATAGYHAGELRGWPAIIAVGEMDASNIEQMRQTAASLLHRDPPVLVIDFRGVTYMDSTGIGVVIWVKRHLDRAGGRLFVLSTQPWVTSTLKVAGLHHLCDIVSDEADLPPAPAG
jgi:anti-anti-sigma factor